MATKKEEIIEIKPIELEEVTIRVRGITPLIEHAWDEKAKREMLEKQMKTESKAKKKEAKNPVSDFINSMYWLTPKPEEMTEEAFENAIANGARFGFPCTGFKQATMSGAYRKGWIANKMALRGELFIVPDGVAHDGTECVEIKGEPPVMREDMVKLQGTTSDIRFRGEFRNWYADLRIRYDKNGNYSLSDIVNFFQAGGFSCGIGEWRAEKDGQNGMFEVVATD